MCSIFRSSNPNNNCDMSGIYHVYVFLKGDNVKPSLPSRLAFLEKGTLCHTKSFVLMFPLPCAGGSSSAMCQRSLEPKHPNSGLTWKLLARNGDSLVWGLFHMNLRAIWLAFFPERFFPFHTFPGTGAAEQPYNAGCLSWRFPKCCEQSMSGILFLNNHPRPSASVKASRPLILKARKLFLCINTRNLPDQTWAFWHIWGTALALPWTESAFPCSGSQIFSHQVSHPVCC